MQVPVLKDNTFLLNLEKADDFWVNSGSGYEIFSSFCSVEDWQKIIASIVQEMVRHRGRGKSVVPNVLDVGAGKAQTALRIYKHLLQHESFRANFFLYEPCLDTSMVGKSLFPGSLATWVDDVREVQEKFDVILFIHTTYYLDFEWYLDFCLNNLLSEYGQLCILALSDDSPFLLEGTVCDWTAGKICHFLDKKKISYHVKDIASHFFMPSWVMQEESLLLELKAFMDPADSMTYDRFTSCLDKTFSDLMVDLKDQLILVSGGAE